MTLEFFITTLIIVALPGTGVIYTLAIGLSQGARAAMIAALGCTLGIVPHVIATVAGLAALLHTSALLFQAIKYLGVLYLFWMAYTIWRDGGALKVEEGKVKRQSTREIVGNAVMINLLNPKLTLFFFAFMPQFVDVGAANATPLMLLLAGEFMALTFVVFALYGLFAAAARDHVISRPAVLLWLRRTFAAAFGLMGLRLALSER
jgi:threonine/homoserine/homoserine lactone efflux protein